MATLSYRPEIDGLRAFAVIPVILFHMGFGFLPGGFIGVDVFFVISGFLITSLLAKELESGSFSFREFWARRVRRILPAMLLTTTVTLCVSYAFGFRPERHLIARQGAAAILSFANIYYWRTAGDYWGTAAEQSPFLHTWSLSVEEQFYLAFPVLLFVVYRFRPKWLPGLMLTVLVASLTLFLYGSKARPAATFYLLPTRAWELAAGCYLAVAMRETSSESRNVASYSSLALAGLCMTMASYVFVPTLNGGLAVGVLGAALVIAFGQSGICNAILSHGSAVHIGKVSYSLYLWHWPVLVLARQLGIASHHVGLVPVIYLLALASYYFVETPLRRRTGAVPAIAGCYVLTLGLCGVPAFSPAFYDTSGFEKPHWYGLYYDLQPGNQFAPSFRTIMATMDVPPREASAEAYRTGGILVAGQEGSTPRIVVLGDSHGVMWADTIRSVSEELNVRTSIITMNGVTPFISLPLRHDQTTGSLSGEEKYAYDRSRLELIESWKPDVAIVCSIWGAYQEADAKDLLDFLGKHCKRVLLMEQPPRLAGAEGRNALQYLIFRGIQPEEGVPRYLPAGHADSVEWGRQLIRTIAGSRSGCRVIPIFDLYARDAEVLALDGKNAVYVDDNHLTTYGARLARSRIRQAVSEAIENAPP